jgi:DNA-binding response OmpR family regulator
MTTSEASFGATLPFAYDTSHRSRARTAHGGSRNMASILLSEADPDVRQLLVVLLERMGHEAIVLDDNTALPASADLLLLEPASAARLEQARVACALDPTLPVVCLSALPAEARLLTRGPLSYLQKPFTFQQLEATVESALAAV